MGEAGKDALRVAGRASATMPTPHLPQHTFAVDEPLRRQRGGCGVVVVWGCAGEGVFHVFR